MDDSANQVQVIELTRAKADVRRFLAVPYAIYEGDPLWVAPLLSDLELVFTDANPLFGHARMKMWVARRNGQDVGRIAGIVDDHHNQYQKDQAAFFGFFESANDPAVARALVDVVNGWARGQGLKHLLGPMNPTTNDECGLLVEGFDSAPMLMMTYNPRYYIDLLEGAGFVKAKDLIAFWIDIAEAPMDRLGRIASKVRARNPGLAFRPIRRKTLAQDLEKVKEVYNAAWAENWGFVPMTNPEVDFMAKRLRPLFREGLIWLAEFEGEPVGFLLAIPDFNVALHPLRGRLLSTGLVRALPYFLGLKSPRQCRVITLGVKDAHRGRGLESVMLFEGLQTGFRMGLRAAEASWILEDNVAMRRMLEVFGAKAYKTYRIYDRPVSG